MARSTVVSTCDWSGHTGGGAKQRMRVKCEGRVDEGWRIWNDRERRMGNAAEWRGAYLGTGAVGDGDAEAVRGHVEGEVLGRGSSGWW